MSQQGKLDNNGINCADPRPFRHPFAYAKGVFLLIYIFMKFILHLPLRINITERKGKNMYIYIYILLLRCKFTGQEKLQKQFKIKCNIK